MVFNFFCAPSLIYLVFGLTQVCLDIYQGYYNMSIMKLIVTIIFTLLLNAICMSGMTVIAWMIIAIPFILMSVIISMLLFVFGLNPKTGRVINNINGKSINKTNNEIKHKTKYETKHETNNKINDVDNKKVIKYHSKKDDLDVREYELLYGNNNLGKEELLYFFNKKIIDNDKHYNTEDDDNKKYEKKIVNKNYKNNKNNKNILIENKKLSFKVDNKFILKDIIFKKNNHIVYNSYNGYYFINGNNININNNLRFKFNNNDLKVGSNIEIYYNNNKLDGVIEILKVENI